MAKADLVLRGAKICAVDRAFSFHEAVAIKDGWIVNVGTDQEIESNIGPTTKVIDLGGKLVLPGMHDSHLHAAFAGLFLAPDFVNVNDVDVPDLIVMNKRLGDAAAKKPPGTWLIGTGFKKDWLRECRERGTSVNRWDIDPSTPHHPVMLTDGGLHRMLVNSKALEICGIDRHTPDLLPEQGSIERDPKTGEPTGMFEEFGAQAVVGKFAYHLDKDELRQCIRRMQRLLNSYGCTSHTDMVGIGGNDLFAGTMGEDATWAYEEMARSGDLTARVAIEVLPGLDGVSSYDAITGGLRRSNLPQFHDKNWVRADSVKIFGDDAWQRPGWQGPQGYSYFPGKTEDDQAREMAETIIEVHRMGHQMGIHLTGGRAIDVALSAFIEAGQRHPGRALRHFLIHGSRLLHHQAPLAAKNRIGLSVQSVGGYYFGQKSTAVFTPEERAQQQDLQAFSRMGLVIAQGSDGPALPMNWLQGLQYVVGRFNRKGEPCHTDMACTLEEGIRMYTANGAHQEHMEDILGSVEVGKLADLQVLERDLFKIHPSEFGEVKILLTLCGGRVVYEA